MAIDRVSEVCTWFRGESLLRLKGGAEVPSSRAYRDRVARLLERGG
ncbi:MAG TPA: LytTR family transcriptional regulator DNA-binding domain-containing protein [Gemmatimonadales bacterium]|nr:LytTR family transcriptional regulator DNA-binding domain-containing protein [Gemmatimonadales bacterium]